MDVAYDHIQEETLPEEPDEGNTKAPGLNEEFQEAFKAVSSSPWGAKLGGFFGQLKTQGESLYSEAQKEYSNASEQATKGFTDLRTNIAKRARGISIQQPAADGSAASFSDPNFVLPDSPTDTAHDGSAKGKARADSMSEKPDSLPADIVKEATSMVSRFRSEAASRLATVRKAEDAADEALLRFGTNVRNFLRDAVTVTGPSADDKKDGSGKTEVLFETNDADGRRVFHSSRFDAQLHAIHSRLESFSKDPEGDEWDKWAPAFDVAANTDRIAADLDKHEELRRAMEKLVPEKVEYQDFWRRYYFLRMAVEEEERRRKEVLKGAAADNDEEVGWGDDDDDDDEASTPVRKEPPASQSTSTLIPPKEQPAAAAAPEPAAVAAAPERDDAAAPRPSTDEDKKSSSDRSDASYDLVSGATSMGPGTPMLGAAPAAPAATAAAPSAAADKDKKDESDDEDWE